MYLGRIVEVASTAGLFAEARHPYTTALLQSVLTPDPGLGIPDTQLGITYPNPIDPPGGCAFHPRCPAVLAVCRPTSDTRRFGKESFSTCRSLLFLFHS